MKYLFVFGFAVWALAVVHVVNKNDSAYSRCEQQYSRATCENILR